MLQEPVAGYNRDTGDETRSGGLLEASASVSVDGTL